MAEYADIHPFEQEMLKRVCADYTHAKEFLRPWHQQCEEAYKYYHNALRYEDLRKVNEFPSTYFQSKVDDFVAYTMDKLFYKNRPCTIVPVEETDEKDAEAKQEMLDWQDYKDKIRPKIERLVRDAALYRVAVAKVDYLDDTTPKVWGVKDVVPDENGNPVEVSRTVVKDVTKYRGATVVPIDPIRLFFTQDKTRVDDGEPIMLLESANLEWFKKQKSTFNLDQLEEQRFDQQQHGDDIPDNIYHKRMYKGTNPQQAKRKGEYDYIEWQGLVDKKKLYEYTGEDASMIKDGQKCHVICWVVEERIIVRLEATPLDFDGPNYVCGTIESDEDEFIGTSLFDKIGAIARGLDVLNGIHLENFRQAVNAQWKINVNKIVKSPDANKPGGVWECSDLDGAVERIPVEIVAPDIYAMKAEFQQSGDQASSVTDVIGGRGEPGAETLGEAEMVAGMASVGITKFIKALEDTLIQPLYDMRNQINMQFLDEEYIYGIIGEGVINWRKIEPWQIRANVDFMCESASRETNRVIITQQILQLAKLLPAVQSLGFPVRLDVLLKQLMEQGFSWPSEKVKQVLPSLQLEEDGVNINGLLQQAVLNALAMQAIVSAPVGAGPGESSGPMPNPATEGDARQSLDAANQPQIPRSA